ncbi:hypothetical protein [Alkalihalobacillus sp. TS-13]|uniref:hypothetical protein n=1 Tax=Alkalihalobacillus sp. TS-13 TaxID=2842455 RepID=UPI001C878ED4|nr:hypothetical protein [Alkalihalobacillus sp. TS-13]
MKLVIDETLGDFQTEGIVIKPVNTKNGLKPIKEVIQDHQSKTFSKSLDITAFNQLDQIHFFKNLSDASEIIYFYDPFYTDSNVIRRLQNWLYPQQSLSSYPIFHNRATLYMLLDKVTRYSHESSDSIINFIEQESNTIQEWVITTDPKVYYKKSIKSIHKKKKSKPYKLLVSENGKAKIKKSGTVEELIVNILPRENSGFKSWLVHKGFSGDLPIDDHVKQHKLEDDNLPVNVPFVHIVTQPTLN